MMQLTNPKVAQLMPGALRPHVCHWFHCLSLHGCQTVRREASAQDWSPAETNDDAGGEIKGSVVATDDDDESWC